MQSGRRVQFFRGMSMSLARFLVLALAVTLFVLTAHDYLSLGRAIPCFTIPFVAGYFCRK